MAKKVDLQKSILLQFGKIKRRIEDTLDTVIQPGSLRPMAREAIVIIVKRTRLGYGSTNDQPFGERYKLPPLSENYMKFRRKFKELSSTTSARKSNLTLTGQLLESIRITKQSKGSITIGPTGNRGSGLSNEKLAGYLDQKGRSFINLTKAEFDQIKRFYRKTFGDLLKNAKLIR